MLDDFKQLFESIEAWWHCKNTSPIVSYKKTDHDNSTTDLNSYWVNEKAEPDYDNLLQAMLKEVKQTAYTGDVPMLLHNYGKRGTPMTIAFYLGGNVKFSNDTVWVEPVINDWSEFDVRFDLENIWFKRSVSLMQKSVESAGQQYLVTLPDLGDALTCFSLLRGTENLLFDLIENKSEVIKARDKFIDLWPEYHKSFWDIYRTNYKGDCSFLGWAPDKSYMCQCDFSALISPDMFKELVVPEIESLNQYLQYMLWHLDGPDQVKHLDILLDIPFIKVIQWNPGAGQKSTPYWLDMLKKIQNKGKSLYLYAQNETEVDYLIKELSPAGLRIEIFEQ